MIIIQIVNHPKTEIDMARATALEKSRSHDRIVHQASLLFRENGIEATGLSEIMTAAGLTHGGFYRHFKSKHALVAAALTHAITAAVSDMAEAETAADKRAALGRYVALYLSPEHVQNRAQGCPLAAMQSELAHQPPELQKPLEDGVAHVLTVLAAAIGGSAPSPKAQALLAHLMGAVSLARLSPPNVETETFLQAARKTAAEIIA
ncbi:TetR/AcrR family transcriptional regulator [Tropicibacter sp. R15_0]|uniref:TetR/AcrR family transcriptional regulator n=1 Tax=Tropicibacter sp. R15_0 TaxID=2821101 RepID=UPI001ADB7014|nr:TetR/AcrR family transcriptional regulator [Tropicibacter sp. R15_0]MBO9467030.1 TetR/AcrR family transcriptional regulator [Tropicibacter sp. R15_0]